MLLWLFSMPSGTLWAQSARVATRIEVSDERGKATAVSLTLIASDGSDRLLVQSNAYGLAFTQLLAGKRYRVTAPGFTNFSSISVPSNRAGGELQVALKLPPAKMRDKTAQEGKGLVLFTYLDKAGKPVKGAQLECKASDGSRYSGITGNQGTARVEVPLNATYTFSVKGYPAFASHSFSASPPLQTAEIRLEAAKYKPKAPAPAQPKPTPKPTPKPAPKAPTTSNTTKPRPAQSHSPQRFNLFEQSLTQRLPPLRDRRDSANAARTTIRNTVKRGRRNAFAIPPRSVKPSPKVTKQVVNGIYLLRQALIEELKNDPKINDSPHLSVIPPLTRNRWDSVVLVVDVTCSMEPFMEEYLLWITLANNAQRVVGCVFFNDGDGRNDSTKKIGATGGVRHSPPRLRTMVDTIVKSISFGCSGDIAENDVEALLYAQRLYPEAKHLVLIADNASPVRDLELAGNLRIPVRVLLCDPQENVEPNPDYVTIAFLTQGTMHMLGEDLEVVSSRANPDALRVGKWQYQWIKGQRVRKR